MVLVVRNPAANAGGVRDTGRIPGSGRSPGGGNDNPLQYACLENPLDRGAWKAIVHGVSSVRHDLATEEREREIPKENLLLLLFLKVLSVT